MTDKKKSDHVCDIPYVPQKKSFSKTQNSIYFILFSFLSHLKLGFSQALKNLVALCMTCQEINRVISYLRFKRQHLYAKRAAHHWHANKETIHGTNNTFFVNNVIFFSKNIFLQWIFIFITWLFLYPYLLLYVNFYSFFFFKPVITR